MNERREKELRQLGLRVSYYRKMKGVTQVQMAKAVGLSRTHISMFEAPNQLTAISLDKLFDIADYLQVPMAKLFDFPD